MLTAQLLGQIERQVRGLAISPGIRLWNGQLVMPGRMPPRVMLTLRSPKVLGALVNPSMGKLARHYVEQDLDIEGDTREAIRMGEALSGAAGRPQRRRFDIRSWFRHSRFYDRGAIRRHYDIDDEFFGFWLDRNRVYSCAYFRHGDDTLDIAQEQKLDHICRKLRLCPGERFLDIGCGWGALVMWAAQHYGVHATGVTLSRNQHEYARTRIREAGLEGLCDVHLLDYRDIPEDRPYDKIASVGMFEHVGKKNLPRYFGKMSRVLRPGGLILNHGITLSSPDRDAMGRDVGEFIDEYVFPGGELVHLSEVIAAMSGQGLECSDVENLRPHYARTLWHWVARLEANKDAAVAKVGEKFFRVWRIYMAGSAHAFERGWMSLFQVLAGKPEAGGQLELPATRDDLYAARYRACDGGDVPALVGLTKNA